MTLAAKALNQAEPLRRQALRPHTRDGILTFDTNLPVGNGSIPHVETIHQHSWPLHSSLRGLPLASTVRVILPLRFTTLTGLGGLKRPLSSRIAMACQSRNRVKTASHGASTSMR